MQEVPAAPSTLSRLAARPPLLVSLVVLAAMWAVPAEADAGGGAAPTISTLASPDVSLGEGVLSDQATVGGLVNPASNGTVTFRLYGPNDATCSGAPTFTDTRPLTLNSAQTGTAQSTSFTPGSPGVYRWVATYNGDVNNTPVSGACGEPSETRTVSKAAPTLSTLASPDVTLGEGALSDQASVGGLVNPELSTVTFNLYGPNDELCSDAPAFTDIQPLTLNSAQTAGTAQSGSYTPFSSGVYRWIATYSGDFNNFGISGECGEPFETSTVSAPDADSDGIADASDQCPNVAGPGPSGCPDISRALSIAYSAETDLFKGILSAEDDGCITGKRVSVFHVDAGPDTRIGSDTTGATGRYKVPKSKVNGKYYAKAKAITVASAGNCLTVKSQTIAP